MLNNVPMRVEILPSSAVKFGLHYIKTQSLAGTLPFQATRRAQFLSTGLERIRATVSRSARLERIGGRPRSIRSMSSSTMSPMRDQSGWRQPRVDEPGVGAEAGEQAIERAAEIAEADYADIGAREQSGGLVAVAAPQLLALPEGKVGIHDAARQVERHGEAKFGDRLGEYEAGGDDVDAAGKQRLIGHVVDEVGLDIEDAAQRLQSLQCFRRDRRLADDVARFGQHIGRQLRHTFGRCLDDAIFPAKQRQLRRREDQVERAWFGCADHQRRGLVGHVFSSRRDWIASITSAFFTPDETIYNNE